MNIIRINICIENDTNIWIFVTLCQSMILIQMNIRIYLYQENNTNKYPNIFVLKKSIRTNVRINIRDKYIWIFKYICHILLYRLIKYVSTLKNAWVGYRFQGAATWPPFCLPSSPSWAFVVNLFFRPFSSLFRSSSCLTCSPYQERGCGQQPHRQQGRRPSWGRWETPPV